MNTKILDAIVSFTTSEHGAHTSTEMLRRAVISSGSSGEANLACASMLELGEGRTTGEHRRRHGLKIVNSNYLASDILYEIEAALDSEALKLNLPDITQGQAKAVIRLMILVLSDLEHEV